MYKKNKEIMKISQIYCRLSSQNNQNPECKEYLSCFVLCAQLKAYFESDYTSHIRKEYDNHSLNIVIKVISHWEITQ